ncbi:hypothetical protein RJ640_025940 [Escallonia rubra]|uniref:Uncharacterized protein n=1 Tax=Escallonia rubra TaxID=112253 RepID=A0AA88RZ15_9ASTE|nr:hypothetical protein RJ640_025940 [Escallonia rubra]
MKTLFISPGLGSFVQNGYEQPIDSAAFATWSENKKKQYYENQMKDAKALLYIQQGVSKTIFPRIMAATVAKEAWDILQNEFKGSDKFKALAENQSGHSLKVLRTNRGENLMIISSLSFARRMESRKN